MDGARRKLELDPSMTKQRPGGVPTPTASELAILRVLWRLGPSTVREVHEQLSESNGAGYTTVLKFLQIMYQKGLVTRDDAQRAHIYTPAVSKDDTQQRMTWNLIDQVFEGSRCQLVMRAFAEPTGATSEEVAQLRALVERLANQEGHSA